MHVFRSDSYLYMRFSMAFVLRRTSFTFLGSSIGLDEVLRQLEHALESLLSSIQFQFQLSQLECTSNWPQKDRPQRSEQERHWSTLASTSQRWRQTQEDFRNLETVFLTLVCELIFSSRTYYCDFCLRGKEILLLKFESHQLCQA